MKEEFEFYYKCANDDHGIPPYMFDKMLSSEVFMRENNRVTGIDLKVYKLECLKLINELNKAKGL